jgi:translation initiation factor 1
MSNLNDLVFANTDFNDLGGADSTDAGTSTKGYVHIRIQQRNGRKSLTTIQGLAFDLDLKKILKALKKTFSTNGTIVNDEELGKVIQLQGDQRKNVLEFFVKYEVCQRSEIKVHGF